MYKLAARSCEIADLLFLYMLKSKMTQMLYKIWIKGLK